MKRIIFTLSITLILTALYACSKSVAGSGAAFEYKSIYLPDTGGVSPTELDINNIDSDWGIWGHNLNMVVPEKHSNSIFANVNGDTEKEQFCFSSNKLFEYICGYIDDNYGRNDNIKFAILPNDNAIVCQCRTCKLLGNTKNDASPAVFDLIGKLSKEYPNHEFFTSYYSSTKGLPQEKMPANSGVLISAMEYPRTAVNTQQETEFQNLIRSWAQHTDKVYVWDYINNFDDYYTPFPILGIMQNRLKMYRDAGVKGVFLNGSGEDYSTFSAPKKKALASLLHNPDADWQQEVRDYCNEHYPVTGNIIADYIIAQEDYVLQNGKILPMYDGIDVETASYLDQDEFVTFHDALLDNFHKISGEERREVENAVKALSFTRLELMRKNGKLDGAERFIDLLAQTDDIIVDYGEAYWPVSSYVKEYRFLKEHHDTEAKNNILKGTILTPRTKLDPDYSDISILTDGVLGIPSNYHSGNLISSADPSLTIDVPHSPGMRKLKVWLVKNEHFKIGLPSEIVLKIGGLRYEAKSPAEVSSRTGRTAVEFDIPAETGGVVSVVIYKDPDTKTMAIDEIEAYK